MLHASRPRGAAVPAAVALSAALAVMAGCGTDVVRLPDCIDCRPVRMDVGQVLEVELNADLSGGRPADPEASSWELADDGTMEVVSADRIRRPEDPDEFLGGYSYSQVWILKPTSTGSTALVFRQAPGGGEAPVDGELSIEVIVIG